MPSDNASKNRAAAPRALIDSARPHGEAGRLRLCFGEPSRVIVACIAAEVRPALDGAEVLAQLATRPLDEACGEFIRLKTTRRAPEAGGRMDDLPRGKAWPS